MKRLMLFLIPVLCLWSCAKETTVQLVDFSDTGCGRETKAVSSPDGAPELILEYSAEGLVLTRHNSMLNCSINQGGIACDVSIEDNTIFYSAYELGEPMKCICPVKTITSTISGLRTGKDYILDYSCGGDFMPISFTYQKGMKLVLDLSLYQY